MIKFITSLVIVWSLAVSGLPGHQGPLLAATCVAPKATFVSGYQAAPQPSKVEPAELTTRKKRIYTATLFGVTILLLLILVFGYLRLDHASRGFYSGKLQTLTVLIAVILLAISIAAYLFFLAG